MKKPRSDKKLAALSEEQATKLWAWLNTPGLGYVLVRDLVKKEFAIETSTRALSEWWEARAQEEQAERFLRAHRMADNMRGQAEHLPDLTEAMKKQLVRQAFELSLAGGQEETVERIMNIVGGMTKAELTRAKLMLESDKFQFEVCERFLDWFRDDKARAIAESDTPRAEKIAALRQMYFADVDALEQAGGVKLPS